MRLYELAYCCRLFGERVGYDSALARLTGGTRGRVDLTEARHRRLMLQWLREWGCRSLRKEDDRRSSAALLVWWQRWAECMPERGASIADLDDVALDAASEAFEDLARSTGPRRQLPDRLTDVRFGATTAAKAMFALRPNAFLPWDEAIRRKLGFREDAASYRRALVRAAEELAEAARDGGVDVGELPALIGRPESTPPKLVDEHDWVRYTAGHEPPGPGELARWVAWLPSGRPA